MAAVVSNTPQRNSGFYFRPENLFLFLGSVYGILFLFAIPPFQAPDEPNHFYRAYQMSEGRFIAEKHLPPVLDAGQRQERAKAAGKIRELFAKGDAEGVVKALYEMDNMGGIGGLLPESLAITANSFLSLIHPENKQDINELFSTFRLPLEENNRVFLHFPNTAVYSPVPYLPQAAGIAVGRTFELSPLFLMYLGRFFNFFVWLLLMYLSIKAVPFCKWLFFLLALMPMTVYEAASLSADGFTMGVSFLLISFMMRNALGEKTDTDLLPLFTLSIALALSKQAYFSMPVLFLLIPKEKIGSTPKFFAFFVLLICSTLAAVMLWTVKAGIHKDIYTIYGFLAPALSPQKQMLFILSHPFEYCRISGETFVRNGRYYLDLFVGDDLPEILRISYIIVLMIAVSGEASQRITISLKQRIIVFVTLLLGVMSVITLAYIGWTPVGNGTIGGVQGRYFIPLSPLFFMLFYRQKNSSAFREMRLAYFITFFSVFTLSYAVYALITRYYI